MESVLPAQVAIDRPSVKFISFLKKHYDLKNAIPQVNCYKTSFMLWNLLRTEFYNTCIYRLHELHLQHLLGYIWTAPVESVEVMNTVFTWHLHLHV